MTRTSWFSAGLIGLLLLAAPRALATEETLVVIHTNDFHGHISEARESAGAARIAAFVNQQRARYDHVLFLDAGDAISGTPVSSMFRIESSQRTGLTTCCANSALISAGSV